MPLRPTRPRFIRTYPHGLPQSVGFAGSTLAYTWSTVIAAFTRQPVLQATNDPMTAMVNFTATGKVIPRLITTSLDLRVAAGVRVTVPIPAIVNGQPLIPEYWAQTSSTAVATGILMIPDPDPIVTPPVGGSNPHPNGVAPSYTWHVSDVSLGNLTDWAPHGGAGPHWQSTAAFAPTVRQTVIYGANGKYHTYTKGVHFDGANVDHMWMDWGSSLSQPFSVVICAIVHHYPERTYGQYLLDAGTATSGSYSGTDRTISEGLSYRSLMLYQSSNAILATHTGADAVRDGKHVITRADFVPRPKMFFGIFNGSSSYIGAWDNANQYINKGAVDVKTHRYFVAGRRQNNVSDNLASHMTMFEMRMFNSAISTVTLKEIYKQMAATWKFNQYHL
jgi:hypothetical protein